MTEVRITGLRSPIQCEEVQVYGITVGVPEDTKYITIDLNGRLTAWKHLPVRYLDSFSWTESPGKSITDLIRHFGTTVAYIRYSGNWEDSLITLP